MKRLSEDILKEQFLNLVEDKYHNEIEQINSRIIEAMSNKKSYLLFNLNYFNDDSYLYLQHYYTSLGFDLDILYDGTAKMYLGNILKSYYDLINQLQN
jgi:hypothetical protein